MEFVHSSTTGLMTRRFNVIDGPVQKHSSSSTGKRYRVEGGQVTYILDRGAGEWRMQSIQLRGPVLRKDGSEGKETFGGNPGYGWESQHEYVWLTKLVDAMRPEGVPELPFRLAGLENDDLEASDGQA